MATPANSVFGLNHYRFPGRAGELQDQGDARGLLREVGSAYAEYHEQLAKEFEAHGGRPDPADYRDYDSYAGDCARALDMVVAEQVARDARALYGSADRQEPNQVAPPPLLDQRHRLCSVLGSDQARAARGGDPAAAAWKPSKPSIYP